MNAIRRTPKPLSFLDVVDLCYGLDQLGTDMMGRRCTRVNVHVSDGTVTFRVRHEEDGEVYDQAGTFGRGMDLENEIRALHRTVDDRVGRHRRLVEHEVLDVPF